MTWIKEKQAEYYKGYYAMTCPKCGDKWCAQDPAGALWCQNDSCGYVWWPPRGRGWECPVHPQHDCELCECK